MIYCAFVLLYLYTVYLCIFNRVNKWQPYNTSTVIYPHWIYDIFQLIDITFQNFKEINGGGWPPIDIRREGRALYTGLYLQYVRIRKNIMKHLQGSLRITLLPQIDFYETPSCWKTNQLYGEYHASKRKSWPVLHVEEQKVFTLPEHLSSLPGFSDIHAARSLVFCVMFCRSLFVLSFFF